MSAGRGRGGGWVVGQSFLMVGALVAAVVWPAPGRSATGLFVGGVLILLGGVVGVAGVVALGPNRTAYPRPREDATLVDQGIYAWIRHPLYASLMLVSFGWAAAWGSLPAGVVALVETVFLMAKARREEAWLRARFPGYAAYQRRVRRFLPGIH